MNIDLKIIYHDEFATMAGREHEVINLDQNIQVTCKLIKEHLRQCYSIQPPYLLKIRGMSMKSAVNNNLELKEGEVVDVLPRPIVELISKISQSGYIGRF
jgi:hypothetical protein